MSIVFINNSQETFTPTSSGAIATWIWEVCQCASKTGRSPWVITRTSEADRYPWEQTIALPYPREPKNRIETLIGRADRKVFGYTSIGLRTYASRVIAAVAKLQAASLTMILHNDLELAVLLRQAFPNAKIVHHFHNQIVCKSRFFRQFYESCDVVTAVSRFTGEWVEREFGLPLHSVKTVFNGVDCDRFSPASSPPAGDPIINFIGRTCIEKAPDLLMSAAIILAQRTKRFSLQILGSNYWHKYEKDQYQLNLDGLSEQLSKAGITIRQAGHVSRKDIPAAMRRCRINVMPSRWDEPFGLATLEGMACGLATVASHTGGTPEVVAGAGLLFSRDDPQSLAKHLWKLLSDESILTHFSNSARYRAEQLTWHATWNAISNMAGLAPRDLEAASPALPSLNIS